MRSIERCLVVSATMCSIMLSAPSAHAQVTGETSTQPPKRPKPNADLITAEQLKTVTYPDVYSAIEALRSNWLRARNLNPPGGSAINPTTTSTTRTSTGGSPATGLAAGQTGMPRDASGIQVYLDGTRLGGIETLKGIPITSVWTIHRISGTDAQARYGIGHSDGVIFVATGPGKESGN